MRISARQAARATGGRWQGAEPADFFTHVCTDSRRVEPGALFVALEGDRFDGHDYVARALEAGAAAAVVHRPELASGLPDRSLLVVEDSLRALGDLAAFWATQCPARRLAVVGSSGKTTTKEMLAGILSARGPLLATRGNFNNLIGLPQTLFELRPEHHFAVLELGMNTAGELDRLTRIADPGLLLLLNIGNAHVGRFPSHEALVEAKAEALRALGPETPVVYNRACAACRDVIRRYAPERPGLSFAVGAEAEVWGQPLRFEPGRGMRLRLNAGGRHEDLLLSVFGRFNLANAVAAAAAAHALGAPLGEIARGLEGFRPAPLRSELREAGGVNWIADCYNASPEGMCAALESFAEWRRTAPGRGWLVLGDMRELGDQSEKLHRELVAPVLASGADGLFLIGSGLEPLRRAWPARRGPARLYEDLESLRRDLEAELEAGDLVLVKGARAHALEALLPPTSEETP